MTQLHRGLWDHFYGKTGDKKREGSQRPTANVIIQGEKSMTLDGLCTLISLTRMVSDVSRGRKKK